MDLKNERSKAKMIYEVFVRICKFNYQANSVNFYMSFTDLGNTGHL